MVLYSKFYSHNKDFKTVREFLISINKKINSFQYLIPQSIENKYGPCGTKYTSADDKNFLIWEVGKDLNDPFSQGNKIIAISFKKSSFTYILEIHPDFTQFRICSSMGRFPIS